jgi:hypothetical protein
MRAALLRRIVTLKNSPRMEFDRENGGGPLRNLRAAAGAGGPRF